MRKRLTEACRASFFFWLNAFVWTYRQKGVDEFGKDYIITGPKANVPFISWPVQDEVVLDIMDCIEKGDDINVEKSRDMGASWLLLALVDWYFLFTRNFNAGVVSRKEMLVDARGDMDSLFEKIRYVHRHLPVWMLPKIQSRYMHLHNTQLNSSIAGESTNQDVGRGGRKSVYLVDEAAAITNAQDIEHSLSQNTPCQIWASTPRGPNTLFHRRIIEGRGRKIQMPWYRHPEKSVGARQIRDDQGRISWTSPWLERQFEKYSRKTVAQEILMDHGQSGDIFFDATEIQRHRLDHEAAPNLVGKLVYKESLNEDQILKQVSKGDCSNLLFAPQPRGQWRFWRRLDSDRRPSQNYTYVFGIDVGNGAGDSNSVISVYAIEIGMIMAKFWDAYISPEDLAVLAAQAGIWFGGRQSMAYIAWENNGPGGIFGRKLVRLGYPFFYRQRATGSVKDKRSPRWGWHNNEERKEELLGNYRDALSRDAVIQPCKESLDECLDYIYDENGRLIPSKLRDEKYGGHALHGDHVIADALSVLASEDLPAGKANRKRKPPPGSFAYRKALSRGDNKSKTDRWLQ